MLLFFEWGLQKCLGQFCETHKKAQNGKEMRQMTEAVLAEAYKELSECAYARAVAFGHMVGKAGVHEVEKWIVESFGAAYITPSALCEAVERTERIPLWAAADSAREVMEVADTDMLNAAIEILDNNVPFGDVFWRFHKTTFVMTMIADATTIWAKFRRGKASLSPSTSPSLAPFAASNSAFVSRADAAAVAAGGDALEAMGGDGLARTQDNNRTRVTAPFHRYGTEEVTARVLDLLEKATRVMSASFDKDQWQKVPAYTADMIAKGRWTIEVVQVADRHYVKCVSCAASVGERCSCLSRPSRTVTGALQVTVGKENMIVINNLRRRLYKLMIKSEGISSSEEST